VPPTHSRTAAAAADVLGVVLNKVPKRDHAIVCAQAGGVCQKQI
jgi:hypothetical protein